MKKVLLVLALVALALALVACGGGGDKPATGGEPAGDAATGEPLTVGFIYIGTVSDGGYTQAQHAGTVAMEEYFGGKVKAIWKEEVDDTNKQAATDAAIQMIDQGAKVIIGTSYGFMDALDELANNPDYAEIDFLHFSGNKMNETNFGNYFGAMEEPRYLSGIVAGSMTKTNKLGYVAAFPYTEVQIGINAFTLGAQSVNPDVEVKVVYINSWYDPANEKAAAEALLDQDCDVITQHADTTGPQLAAAAAGKYCIGYNLDNSGIADLEKAFLTAPVWHHEVYLIPTVQAILDGSWTPESYYGTMADGYIGLAPLTANVPDDITAKVTEVQQQIEAGTKPIFVGPIKDNAGKERVPEGTTLDRSGIWAIDYLVAGASE
ncbi:MAG: BMP family ABC transporter substrate-binding protein [Actinomycetes bacterium]|jgi:basic membrane protein A|nr:BMP family ABC transporter substrate-binding protein [Actinomycetes bacterium]